MQADEFYGHVQQASHLDTRDRTREATTAVLETLAETLTAGESEDVAQQLPGELAGVVQDADHDGAGYAREEFVDRVGERLRETDLESDDAQRYVDAVTDAVAVALTDGELQDLKAQLADGLQPLFEDVAVDRENA